MRHVTAPRAALAAALLAVVAPMVATNALIAFYLTFVALAGMLGATFLSYLDLVDRPGPRAAAELGICAVAMLFIMLDAAVRFPTVLDGSAPDIAGTLALGGLVVAAAGAVATAIPELHVDDLRGHLRTLRG